MHTVNYYNCPPENIEELIKEEVEKELFNDEDAP